MAERGGGATQPTIPGASPARRYTWAPTGPGNLLALKHGAYSPRIIGPLAEELIERVLENRPELSVFPFALGAWARAETRVALLTLYLDAGEIVDESGEPRERLLRELRAEERRAAEERRELGLSPSAYWRLQRETAEAGKGSFDLGKLLDAGRRIRVEAFQRLGIDEGGPTEGQPGADQESGSEVAQ
jgi:hypothetical protein